MPLLVLMLFLESRGVTRDLTGRDLLLKLVPI